MNMQQARFLLALLFFGCGLVGAFSQVGEPDARESFFVFMVPAYLASVSIFPPSRAFRGERLRMEILEAIGRANKAWLPATCLAITVISFGSIAAGIDLKEAITPVGIAMLMVLPALPSVIVAVALGYRALSVRP